jgi:GcrA cell cycle regulator
MATHVEALCASARPCMGALVGQTGWTPERVERLKTLAAENKLSARQIGTELGFRRGAVLGKLKRLGISIAKPAKPTTCRKPRRRGARKARGPRSYSYRSPKAARDLAIAAARELQAIEAELERAVLLEPPATAIRSVLELRAGVCRYPFGDPRHPNFCFCGGEAFQSLPYCAGHARLSYRPVAAR